MDNVVSYKGKAVVDVAAFYCPYIPLQVIGAGPSFKQIGLVFEFELASFSAAYEWLLTECVWERDIVLLGTVLTIVKVTFSDPKGAIEFKLRFCE